MKIRKTILTAAILMAAVCLPAQNKSAGINISIWKDICTQPHDSTQTTYVNIGLLSTLNRLNGVGINALGSVVHGDMNGVQITGLNALRLAIISPILYIPLITRGLPSVLYQIIHSGTIYKLF